MPIDPSAPTDRQLRWALWWVNNKPMLKKGVVVFLVVIIVGLGGYTLYGLTRLYLIDYARDRATRDQAPISLVNPGAAGVPQNVEVRGVQVFDAGPGKADVVATLRNPNPQHGVTFRYQVTGAGMTAQPLSGFLLPGEEKKVAALGIASANRTKTARLEFSDIVWRRVDSHAIPNYIDFASDRLRISAEDVVFAPPSQSAGVSRVTFTANNATAFGYWNVRFLVFLYRGSALIGVNAVELAQLASGEQRPASATWFERVATPTKVIIVPEVNILDDSVYMR